MLFGCNNNSSGCGFDLCEAILAICAIAFIFNCICGNNNNNCC